MTVENNRKLAEYPIGIFDSGVGGLTVLRKLNDLLPAENLIYLGDTARVPYGNKSPELIRYYAQQCTQFLLAQSVKLIIVACNTVSAVALDVVQAFSPVPVIGMILPGANAAIAHAPHANIGVIGTQATIRSKAYENALRQLNPLALIHAKACPLFVPLAEEGWHSHAATKLVGDEYLKPLQQAGIESLILGCTHYPLLKTIIQEILPGVDLIDSGEEAALVAKTILENSGRLADFSSPSVINCFVTDLSIAFSTITERVLGKPFSYIKQISLDSHTDAADLLAV